LTRAPKPQDSILIARQPADYSAAARPSRVTIMYTAAHILVSA